MHSHSPAELLRGPPTQAVRDKAADKNIAIATEGTVIMGAPVGTDEYINTTVADRVDDLLHDLHTLKRCYGCASTRGPSTSSGSSDCNMWARPSNVLMQLSQRSCWTSLRWRVRTTETRCDSG
jgi:hypothetical protein